MQEILVIVDRNPQNWGDASTVRVAERAASNLARDLAAIANCLFPEARVRCDTREDDTTLLRTEGMADEDTEWLREKLAAWCDESRADALRTAFIEEELT